MNFVDWIPGIFSALGMIIINSIDKTRLSADNWSYSGDGVAWKARVVLFMGFAAMAGGLAGGVVREHPSTKRGIQNETDVADRLLWSSSTSFRRSSGLLCGSVLRTLSPMRWCH